MSSITKQRKVYGTTKPGVNGIWKYRCEIFLTDKREYIEAMNTDGPYWFAKLWTWWKVITYQSPKPPKSYYKEREL